MADDNDENSGRGGIVIPKLKKGFEGERKVAMLFLITICLLPFLYLTTGAVFGFVETKLSILSRIKFTPDLSFVGVWLGRIWIGTVIAFIVYCFARLAGVNVLTGVVNFADAMLDGYSSPRLKTEDRDEE